MKSEQQIYFKMNDLENLSATTLYTRDLPPMDPKEFGKSRYMHNPSFKFRFGGLDFQERLENDFPFPNNRKQLEDIDFLELRKDIERRTIKK